MTVIVEYFGFDLKDHVVELSDYTVAEQCTYSASNTVLYVLNRALEKIGAPGIAQLKDTYYRDDEE